MTTPALPRRVRVYQPENRLTKLVARPGGLPRVLAIAEATRRLEAQRLPALKAIGIFVATLEAIVTSGPCLVPGQLPDIRRITNQLISLASAYDLAPLAEAGKRLGDLIVGFAATQMVCQDSIMVHVRALRLLAGGDTAPAAAAGILAELDKVLAHFQFAPCESAALI